MFLVRINNDIPGHPEIVRLVDYGASKIVFLCCACFKEIWALNLVFFN